MNDNYIERNQIDTYSKNLSEGKIHVATFPRTGSTYLWWIFHISFGKNVYKTHIVNEPPGNDIANLPRDYYWKMNKIFFKDEDYVVNILRDPIDTVSSMLVQEYFYLKNKVDLEKYIDDNVESRIRQYNIFHHNVPKLCELILNYEDINLYRNKIVNHISKETGKKIISTDYKYSIKDNVSTSFLKSSKVFDNYNFVREQASNRNLVDSYSIYNNLLKKCKNFK